MKRIVFITGYYGTGKTEVALNMATLFHADYLVDLDIINPYFRSREMKDKLDVPVDIISSDLEKDQYTDLPYLSKKIFLPFHQMDKKAFYDLGGNDLCAKLIRQFPSEDLAKADLYMVINVYRSETVSVEAILQLIDAVEKEGGMKITGLINNSNLLSKTTIEDIVHGEKLIQTVSQKTDIPIVYTCVEETIDMAGVTFDHPVLRLKRFFQKAWLN